MAVIFRAHGRIIECYSDKDTRSPAHDHLGTMVPSKGGEYRFYVAGEIVLTHYQLKLIDRHLDELNRDGGAPCLSL